MTAIEVPADLAQLDVAIEALPNQPAVFVLWPKEGDPYLSKTGLLRRRMLRLLKEREKPSRLLNLRHTVARIEYHLTGSAFESSVVQYEQARRLFPEAYLDQIKLRMPPYVKIVLANEFPRSHITTHLTRTSGLYFGPFRSRVSAERFESQFLDLFQMRRCQEDLVTSPEHPGCIYGEMAMCLRPCQEVVGRAEYAHEVERVVEFLRSDGRSLVTAIEHSRDRLSEEMMFEEAARQHKRLEKVLDVLKLRDELARDVDRLHGVAITRSLAADAVDVVPARRQLAYAAAIQFRGAGGHGGVARSQAARHVRRIGACETDGAGAAGVPGAAGALVLLELARWRMAELRKLRRHTVPEAGECGIAGGAAGVAAGGGTRAGRETKPRMPVAWRGIGHFLMDRESRNGNWASPRGTALS